MKLLILFTVFFLGTFSSSLAEEDELLFVNKNKEQLIRKTDAKQYSIILVTSSQSQLLLYQGERFPNVKIHDSEFIEIIISCGSPCNSSIFYDFQTKQSSYYYGVMAVYANKKVAAVLGEKHLEVVKIFEKKDNIIKVIEKDFSPVAALFSAFEKVFFLPNGDLCIRYLKGSEYVTKEEKITIVY